MNRPEDERGSLSLELVVLAPAILAILALVIVGGRTVLASQAIAQAAAQAARDASQQPTAAAATTAAKSRATSVLAGQGLDCTDTAVTVDAAALNAPPGVPGAVNVTVECTVTWRDLAVIGPGTRTLHATGRAPIDTWTAR
jgi:Flp pilus assembly protein TadG